MDEIEFQSVTKCFGPVEVLRGIDLGVARGAFCVILGPSGCGKSTLLRLFAGLERLSGGTVRLGGRVLNELAPKDRDVAMVFQNYALYPHMTVAQNLGYALKVAGVARAERDERVRAVAATLQLGTLLDRRPGELSGGQRQRVAMGRAIVRRPRVFLFDEPLSNLDAKLRTQMRLEIKRLHLKLGVTSLFVTHDQVEAMTLADRLVVMNGGAIEQIGSPADVYRAPSSAFVAGFLGTPAMNLLPASVAAGGLWAELDAGLRVPLAPGAAGLRRLTVGIRPEHLALDPVSGTALPVELVEELGNGRLVHLRLGETLLSLTLPETDRRPVGTFLPVTLPAEAVHLFDADTGAALTFGAAARPAALAHA